MSLELYFREHAEASFKEISLSKLRTLILPCVDGRVIVDQISVRHDIEWECMIIESGLLNKEVSKVLRCL